MSLEQLMKHHEDNTMPTETIPMTWVPGSSYGGRWGYWRRETQEEEALRILAEADMLPEYKEEELPE
jgi:hypothetical protein